MENRYFLLYSLQSNHTFRNICILDSKMNRVYCGSPIGSDSVSLKEYGYAINGDSRVPIDKNLFLKIKKESFIEWNKKNYLEFFNKYKLEEWLV